MNTQLTEIVLCQRLKIHEMLEVGTVADDQSFFEMVRFKHLEHKVVHEHFTWIGEPAVGLKAYVEG